MEGYSEEGRSKWDGNKDKEASRRWEGGGGGQRDLESERGEWHMRTAIIAKSASL